MLNAIIIIFFIFSIFLILHVEKSYALTNESSSTGIFDFKSQNQIAYQISHGDIVFMEPNSSTNTLLIGVYGNTPNTINLHIPYDVMNGDKFFAYLVDNESKIFLETDTIFYRTFDLTHVQIKLTSPSWHDETINSHFTITLGSENFSHNLKQSGQKLSNDSGIIEEFHDAELGISFSYPADMRIDQSSNLISVVPPESSTYSFHVGIDDNAHPFYDSILNEDTVQVKKMLNDMFNQNINGSMSSMEPLDTDIGGIYNKSYFYEFFSEDAETSQILGIVTISKVEDAYFSSQIMFASSKDSYQDMISRTTVILSSLDVSEFVNNQLSKTNELNEEMIVIQDIGLSLTKPEGWKQIGDTADDLLQFSIVDYYSYEFPVVIGAYYDDPVMYELNTHTDLKKYLNEYYKTFEISEISDVRMFEFDDHKMFTFIEKVYDEETNTHSHTSKSALLIHKEKILDFYLFAESDVFSSNVSDFDYMISTIECCDIDENYLYHNDDASKNQNQNNGGGCLIATAAFGSEMAPQVQFLREIRDNTVMSTQSGTTFMNGFNQFYYSFSPYVADYERENPVFKEAVKVTLTPMLTSLALLNYVDIDTEEEMLGYGIGIILLNIGMYFVAPAVIIVSLKKRLFI